MTLKEKFENNIIGVIGEEQIADDYAIEFAEWCCARTIGVDYFKLNKEELEQFKKEKKL